jgi:integrase
MLGELNDHGRVDILRALRDNVVQFRDVFARWSAKGISDLPNVAHAKPLRPAITEWLAKMEHTGELRPETLRGYGVVFDLLLKGVTEDAPVSRLPDLLAQYRDTAGGARTFNQCRAACMSFVRRTFGKRHDGLWGQVADIEVRKTHRRRGTPLAPEQALVVAKALGRRHGAQWWAMCCTGMSPSEFFDYEWEVLKDRVVIHGQKREGRERIVPRLCNPSHPYTAYKAFYRRLVNVRAELAKTDPFLGRIVPRDARRSFAHWMESAGIIESRRESYMGHKPGARVIRLYEDHAVEPYLTDDALALKHFVGIERLAFPLGVAA